MVMSRAAVRASCARTCRRADRAWHGGRRFGSTQPDRNQVLVGGEARRRDKSHKHDQVVDAGLRYGMTGDGVMAMGKNMCATRKTPHCLRIIAELGAQYVKDLFTSTTASRPSPPTAGAIVMAGGRKLPENRGRSMAYNAVQQGRRGGGHGTQTPPVGRARKR